MDLYSRKLTGTQKWYTGTEKKLPITVESMKEFQTILIV